MFGVAVPLVSEPTGGDIAQVSNCSQRKGNKTIVEESDRAPPVARAAEESGQKKGLKGLVVGLVIVAAADFLLYRYKLWTSNHRV